MKGAILGDIIGSRFEFIDFKENINTFELFSEKCFFTDDTVLTIATMDAILNNISFGEAYFKWGNKYLNMSYGNSFRDWLSDYNSSPYNSFGNGSAMRVSPVGMIATSMIEAIYKGEQTALPTHNHIEGLIGASATSLAIYLAKTRKTKEEIAKYIGDIFEYNLNRTLKEIKPNYYYSEICRDTIPESIICFLESESWEDCMRKTVWLDGDTDTMCAIAGGIAEAYYGIPIEYEEQIKRYLPKEMIEIVDEYYDRFEL